ncbi:MAG: hypothetical protein Q8N51_07215 [Gammaproteobacteria bacterium]|nr:hypothetical protein [Gammaproteobacteria bacterium]
MPVFKNPKGDPAKPPSAEDVRRRAVALSALVDKLVETTPFLAYCPFLTYSDSKNYKFLNSKGMQIHRNPRNPDSDAIWRIGRDAYTLLKVTDQADFGSRFVTFMREIQILKHVMLKELAEAGLSDPDGKELAWGEVTPVEALAMTHSRLKGKENRGELLAFACLREIDDALMGMDMDGRGAVAAAVQAAHTLADAQAFFNGSEQFRSVRSQMAYAAAMARHSRDPKQADKKFVYECYRDWRANPSRYKSKAAFARDMLDKCEHLESQKKIEDWVRKWDSTEGDGTLPAG